MYNVLRTYWNHVQWPVILSVVTAIFGYMYIPSFTFEWYHLLVIFAYLAVHASLLCLHEDIQRATLGYLVCALLAFSFQGLTGDGNPMMAGFEFANAVGLMILSYKIHGKLDTKYLYFVAAFAIWFFFVSTNGWDTSNASQIYWSVVGHFYLIMGVYVPVATKTHYYKFFMWRAFAAVLFLSYGAMTSNIVYIVVDSFWLASMVAIPMYYFIQDYLQKEYK